MQEVRGCENQEVAALPLRARTGRPIRRSEGEWNHQKQHNTTTTTEGGVTSETSCLQLCGRIVKRVRNKIKVATPRSLTRRIKTAAVLCAEAT